jgi:hypothetical protein
MSSMPVPARQNHGHPIQFGRLERVSFEVMRTCSYYANERPEQNVKNDEASYERHIVHLLGSNGSTIAVCLLCRHLVLACCNVSVNTLPVRAVTLSWSTTCSRCLR